MVTPPRLPRGLLGWVLAGDPAFQAILGDLHEDFVRLSRLRGPVAARRWYWREAVLLAAGRLLRPSPTSRWDISDMYAPHHVRSFWQDASYAARSLRRAPGFSLFTALIIGLGVGAATAVYTVVRPLILAPLPFQDPQELVWIANVAESGKTSLSHVTSRARNLMDFRERSSSFAGLTGYNAFSDQTAYTLTGSGEPERLVGFAVAHDLLDVLGVQPVHGRGFSVEEGFWGGPKAVILSHGFWRTHFGGDPDIVGRSIILDGEAWPVVGVLPSSFDFSSLFSPGVNVDFLLPFPISAETDQYSNTLVILGRLNPGVSVETAQAELDGIIAGLQEEQPDRWGLGAEITPLQAKIAGLFRPALLLLVAAAGTLLLIVCVNVSNLLLARSPGRAREVAIRKALGASRARLARQLVLEMIGISLVGAAVGGGLAWTVTRFIEGAVAFRIPLLSQMTLDGKALLVGTGVAVLTGVLVSLVPAFQVAESGEATVLKSESRGSTSGGGGRRLRESLVVAEVALACTLLVVVGLLARSFRVVLDVDLGFQPENAVAWQLNPSRSFASSQEETEFYRVVTDRVEGIPGVEAVGLIDALPLGRNSSWTLQVVGMPSGDDEGIGFFPHVVDSGYLAAMKIPLVEGRGLTEDDTEEAPPVILMNESGARTVFRGENPLGQHIQHWDGQEWEVVGIVGDVRHISPEMDPGVQVYFSLAQMSIFPTLDLVVRSALPKSQTVGAVGAALREVDPSMPTRQFWTLESTVARSVSARSFTLWILSAYGAVALLLAGLGIFGVLSQSVAERTPEIGIRMALGATGREVVRSVMGRTVLLAGLGIGIGAVAATWAGRLLGALLFGVDFHDPLAFAGMAVVLFLVAILAGLVPAARAARIRGIRALQAH